MTGPLLAAVVMATSGDDAPLWLLAAGPAGAVATYWALYRYYRNTDKSHAYERDTIIAAQPVLRLRKRPDGSWNLQGLLADPWPEPPLEDQPALQILNGTVELREGPLDDPPVMVLQGVTLRAEPTRSGGPT